MLFLPIFTKGIKAKLNELESESDIFPQNEGKVGKSELIPVVKAFNNQFCNGSKSTNFSLELLLKDSHRGHWFSDQESRTHLEFYPRLAGT